MLFRCRRALDLLVKNPRASAWIDSTSNVSRSWKCEPCATEENTSGPSLRQNATARGSTPIVTGGAISSCRRRRAARLDVSRAAGEHFVHHTHEHPLVVAERRRVAREVLDQTNQVQAAPRRRRRVAEGPHVETVHVEEADNVGIRYGAVLEALVRGEQREVLSGGDVREADDAGAALGTKLVVGLDREVCDTQTVVEKCELRQNGQPRRGPSIPARSPANACARAGSRKLRSIVCVMRVSHVVTSTSFRLLSGAIRLPSVQRNGTSRRRRRSRTPQRTRVHRGYEIGARELELPRTMRSEQPGLGVRERELRPPRLAAQLLPQRGDEHLMRPEHAVHVASAAAARASLAKSRAAGAIGLPMSHIRTSASRNTRSSGRGASSTRAANRRSRRSGGPGSAPSSRCKKSARISGGQRFARPDSPSEVHAYASHTAASDGGGPSCQKPSARPAIARGPRVAADEPGVRLGVRGRDAERERGQDALRQLRPGRTVWRADPAAQLVRRGRAGRRRPGHRSGVADRSPRRAPTASRRRERARREATQRAGELDTARRLRARADARDHQDVEVIGDHGASVRRAASAWQTAWTASRGSASMSSASTRITSKPFALEQQVLAAIAAVALEVAEVVKAVDLDRDAVASGEEIDLGGG